ncbi:trichohyalin-like [Ostrinia furnacalis]|uniref:trichohyalin-like n=1 Tax=Ostrinia furnacalis TaxID=93504 RepID=UPI001040027C|nr:trichohyalin-like [Ostrinia furnacalis]
MIELRRREDDALRRRNAMLRDASQVSLFILKRLVDKILKEEARATLAEECHKQLDLIDARRENDALGKNAMLRNALQHVLDSPERDWRLLAALAKKRDESDDRERLAEEFQRMWQKEKQEREMVTSTTKSASPGHPRERLAAAGCPRQKRDERDQRERLAEEFQRMWQKEKEEREMVTSTTKSASPGHPRERLAAAGCPRQKRDERDQRERLAEEFQRMWQKEKEEREMSRDVLDIPERDWRLLAALAKKRDESDERERLAEEFQRMWQKEKEEREMVEAETLDQYKRYLAQKRHQERLRLEHKQLRQATEQQLKQGELLNCIRYKQRRSDDLRALIIDQKVTDIVDKALEEEARATLAADRRLRQSAAEECRRQLDLADARRREDDALRRRNAMLRDASQRAAISNALSSWETTLLRQEVSALEAARRASHAARAALTEVRSARIARARDVRLKKARRLAAITAQMREAVRSGRTQ